MSDKPHGIEIKTRGGSLLHLTGTAEVKNAGNTFVVIANGTRTDGRKVKITMPLSSLDYMSEDQ